MHVLTGIAIVLGWLFSAYMVTKLYESYLMRQLAQERYNKYQLQIDKLVAKEVQSMDNELEVMFRRRRK